jgi:cytochrome bd ubiquinol oxidase subunit II
MAETVVAIAAVVTIVYALFGGADFGGGIWDLLAFGPRRIEQRAAIAKAMGPVWEANHVWLIFLIVILFTAFPVVYTALSVALYLPFHFVLLGIVLRGASFVFRSYAQRSGVSVSPAATAWGVTFGVASTVTPFLLGTCLGAVATGAIRVSAEEPTLERTPWLTPLALTFGAIALALCAYLAAIYLVNETEGMLQGDFRKRAWFAWGLTVVLSAGALPLVRSEAGHLWQGLTSPLVAPIIVIGLFAGVAAAIALYRGRYWLARAAAVVQVTAILSGWMLAQHPYLIYPDVTVSTAAAPPGTLRFFLVSLPIGAAILLPSLWLLLRVFKGDALKPDT